MRELDVGGSRHSGEMLADFILGGLVEAFLEMLVYGTGLQVRRHKRQSHVVIALAALVSVAVGAGLFFLTR